MDKVETNRNRQIIALVVDDNEISRMTAAAVLANCGVDTVLADSGVQALAFAQSNRFDLIFLDHRMPVMDGEETVRRIRALGGWWERVPVIGLSADEEGGVVPGMNDRLTKPLNPTLLKALLSRWQSERCRPPQQSPGSLPEEWRRVQQICPEMDARAALHQFGGDYTAYRNVLRVFCSGVEENTARINILAAREEWENLRIAVHAQKGALYNIGARADGERAQDLETLMRKGEYALAVCGLPQLVQRLQHLKERLSPLCAKECGPVSTKPIATKAQRTQVREHIQRILLLLERLERDDAMREMNQLTASQYGEAADRLLVRAAAAIENFDYDGASVLLQEAGDAVLEV